MSKEIGQSLGDRAYEIIRNAIIEWDLEPGAQVTELHLATTYDLGRAPVRAALVRLCHDHLIDSIPRHGYVIAPITFQHIQDSLGVRLITEPAIARIVASRPDPGLIERLEAINDACRYVGEPYDARALRWANRDFHLCLAEATGNQRLVEIERVSLDEMLRMLYIPRVTRESDTVESTFDEHADIIEAIRARDPDAAEAAAARHVEHNRDNLYSVLIRSETVRSINLGERLVTA